MLKYRLQNEDLQSISKFPFSKVLQAIYGSKSAYLAFYPKVSYGIGRYKKGKLSLKEVETYIYHELDKIKEDYPDDFDLLGWYSKNRLVELWLEGRISIDDAGLDMTLDISTIEQEKFLPSLPEVGDRFKSRRLLEAAFSDIIPRYSSPKKIKEILANYAKIEYRKQSGWEIVEIFESC